MSRSPHTHTLLPQVHTHTHPFHKLAYTSLPQASTCTHTPSTSLHTHRHTHTPLPQASRVPAPAGHRRFLQVKVSPPTPTAHSSFRAYQLSTCLQAPTDALVPGRSKRTKSTILSITRGRLQQLSDAALYLGNSTLAWQGRPRRCRWPFPFLTGLLPHRVAFHAARSHSDHTCISNSAAEDLNIRREGSLDYRNHMSLVVIRLG